MSRHGYFDERTDGSQCICWAETPIVENPKTGDARISGSLASLVGLCAVLRPFFGRYDQQATWLSDLKPAFGEERFFYQDELERYYRESLAADHPEDYE